MRSRWPVTAGRGGKDRRVRAGRASDHSVAPGGVMLGVAQSSSLCWLHRWHESYGRGPGCRGQRPAAKHAAWSPGWAMASSIFLFAATPTGDRAWGGPVKSEAPVHSPGPGVSSPKPILSFLLPSKSPCSWPVSCALTPPRSARQGQGSRRRPAPLPPWPAPALVCSHTCCPACLRPVWTCLSGGPGLAGWPGSNAG